jgi:hypothetical protein
VGLGDKRRGTSSGSDPESSLDMVARSEMTGGSGLSAAAGGGARRRATVGQKAGWVGAARRRVNLPKEFGDLG